MKGPRKHPDEWLSENEAHRLLARAVELDAQHHAAMSVEDLQRAAIEAGIEPDAFVQALSELRSGALEPSTIGQRVASRLAGYRGPAVLAAFATAAGVTPGDAVVLSILSGLTLYGAFEGLLALARTFGTIPPNLPPGAQRVEVPPSEQRPEPLDPPGARFVLPRRYAIDLGPSIG